MAVRCPAGGSCGFGGANAGTHYRRTARVDGPLTVDARGEDGDARRAPQICGLRHLLSTTSIIHPQAEGDHASAPSQVKSSHDIFDFWLGLT